MKKARTPLFNKKAASDIAIGAFLSFGFTAIGFLSRSFFFDIQANIFNVF